MNSLFTQNQFKISFNEDMKKRIRFQRIRYHSLLDPKLYPFATMIFQSLASIIVALECILMERPDIFIDTMGCAFAYPFVRLFGWCYIVVYVHYPIISTDMLNSVREQRPSYNNNSIISSNITVSTIKLLYYQVFAFFYALVGYCAQLVIVNSSWTEAHICQLWNITATPVSPVSVSVSTNHINGETNKSNDIVGNSCIQSNNNNKRQQQRKLVKIYPPCNTNHLLTIPLVCNDSDDHSSTSTNTSTNNSRSAATVRQRKILSVGQFRPEKDHMLQLKALQLLLQINETNTNNNSNSNNNSSTRSKYDDVRLVLLGSVRNDEDAALVSNLQRCAEELKITSHVEFVINAPYNVLLDAYRTSGVGIHTMWNEHFGISIVEMMVAGVVVVAHKSGGPMTDILVPHVQCDGDICRKQEIGKSPINEINQRHLFCIHIIFIFICDDFLI